MYSSAHRTTHVLDKSCELWVQELLRGEMGMRGWRETMQLVVQVEETDPEEATSMSTETNKVKTRPLLFRLHQDDLRANGISSTP